jgi:hypothetical protein
MNNSSHCCFGHLAPESRDWIHVRLGENQTIYFAYPQGLIVNNLANGIGRGP